jgi:hypothetical protein
MATVRSSRVSRARYTSPIPPAPSGARISYGPSLVAGASGIGGRDYNLGLLRSCSRGRIIFSALLIRAACELRRLR